MKKTFFIFADGGSRGNPGPAAVGFVVKDSSGKILIRAGKTIGKATNNVAEYRAIIESLKWISRYESGGEKWETSREMGVRSGIKQKHSTPPPTFRPTSHIPSSPSITFFLDSKLIVNQLNGLFKIKKNHLRNLIVKVRQLEKEVGGNVSYRLIPREKNREADNLVNQSLNSCHST